MSIPGLGSTDTDDSQMIELRTEQVSLDPGSLALRGGYTPGTVLGDACSAARSDMSETVCPHYLD